MSGLAATAAMETGWITTEVGRQPWIVYGHMRAEDAVTRSDDVEIALVVIVLAYAALLGGVAWLLRRLTAHPEPEPAEGR